MEQPMAQGAGNPREGVSSGIVRGTAISAALGGLFLSVYATMMALKPRGCIAEECVGQSYREVGTMELILFLAALGLIAVAALGVFRMHRFGGRGSRVVRIGMLIGAISLVAGAIFGASSPITGLWWLGFLALAVAFLSFAVSGAGLMRSRVLPSWSGAMLLVTSVLLFAMNDQNERVLFVLPFGAAWMVLGGLLWSAEAAPSKGWHGRIQHA